MIRFLITFSDGAFEEKEYNKLANAKKAAAKYVTGQPLKEGNSCAVHPETGTKLSFEGVTWSKLFTVIRVFKVEIAKSLQRDWADLGADLRAARSVSFRCMQGAFENLIRYDTDKLDRPTNEKSGKAYHAETLAYHGAKDALKGYNDWVNKKNKELEKKAEKVRKKLKKKKLSAEEKEELEAELKALKPITPAKISGGTLSAWSREVYTRWKTWKKGGRSTKPPSWGKQAGIMIRQSEVSYFMDGKYPAVSLNFWGREEKFAIRPGHGGLWKRMEQVVAGEIKSLDASIHYKKGRKKNGSKGKWMLHITYQVPDPKPKTGSHWLVIHRGTRNLFTLLCTNGRYQYITGAKLRHQKACLLARKSEVMRAIGRGETGRGSRGRGRNRKFAPYQKRENQIRDLLRTANAQVVRRILEIIRNWDVGGVIIEDFDGISNDSFSKQKRKFITLLPIAESKRAVLSALEVEGYQVRQEPAYDISTKCPNCEYVDEKNHVRHRGMFHCRKCEFGHNADYVAAYWLLVSAFPGDPSIVVKDYMRKSIQLAQELRKGGEAAE